MAKVGAKIGNPASHGVTTEQRNTVEKREDNLFLPVQAWEYYELSGFANSLTSPPPLLPATLGGGAHALLPLASPSVDSTHT
jgi:hypothetical protein